MSFRNRLGLFFIVIVIVPMLAVAFQLFGLIGESVEGQANAGVVARHKVATQLYERYRRAAAVALTEVATDARMKKLLLVGNKKAAAERARQLVKGQAIERIVLVKGSSIRFSRGDTTAIAPAVRDVVSEQGTTLTNLGALQVSVVDAGSFARETKSLTRQEGRRKNGRLLKGEKDVPGLDIVVRDAEKVLASTVPSDIARSLPTNETEVSVKGQKFLALTFEDPWGFARQKLSVTTLGSLEAVGAKITRKRLEAGGILLGFFLLAIACGVLVSKALGQQIAGFLTAARRLAAGDFSAKVPTGGRDEFAALGDEFNKMSRELEQRLAQLAQERVRVQDSMRRLGEAVASNLDRDTLLELVVSTAVDGVGADAGRACVRGVDSTTLQERSRIGNINGLEPAVESVEADAFRSGSPREVAIGDAYAIAHPLRGAVGNEAVVGVVSVGRSGRPFAPSDRDLFSYLAGQAARSMENVQLHETAARESVTDDLTGLSNRRAFDDALTAEIERSKRFGTELGLVIIDLDNFKHVNDTYGHQQGDLVLREVARVLRESSREVDHPARYGGEELALVLPGTDLEGAYNLAERVRERIAELRIPRTDGAGAMSVTTSCGVAAVPTTAADGRALLAAADAALYEAKRKGKNMSVRGR
ncbi:MAG TPA: diguanylate cyclase [Solirubrobacteraceae bacterium]